MGLAPLDIERVEAKVDELLVILKGSGAETGLVGRVEKLEAQESLSIARIQAAASVSVARVAALAAVTGAIAGVIPTIILLAITGVVL